VARLRHLALYSEVVSGVLRKKLMICVCRENESVMKVKKQIRSKWLTIRLNEDEENNLNRFFKQTTSGSLSEYARDVLLKAPVNIIYRNQSADDFLSEMILLKNELNAIGKNFNQAVHKLHTLDHIQEIKTWAILNEAGRKNFMKKADEIKEKMNQIYTQWLQK
jgi:predicted nucleic acid-binding OB-fold protein